MQVDGGIRSVRINPAWSGVLPDAKDIGEAPYAIHAKLEVYLRHEPCDNDEEYLGRRLN
jgi:hypothetical protein